VHSVFCEFIENSNTVVSFHHTITLKSRLEDDEIESLPKRKKCDVGLQFSDTSRSTIQRCDSVR
jgi:hypothetical protein